MRIWILLLVATVSIGAQEPTRFTRWVWDGVYTTQQATRGEPLYRQYCAECHGPELQGRMDFPLWTSLPRPAPNAEIVGVKRGTPPLKGATFISNWADLSLGDVFERNRISMPQDRPGRLSRQQNADILAYMLQENGYPPGNGELGLTKEELDTIRIGK